MKIQKKQCKSILSSSGIYGIDYSVNPYIGCQHNCKYCYATYMKKFTDHKEPWGEFVDIKTNAKEVLKKEIRKKKKGKILLSSVTDPYQPIEKKQQITKELLKTLKNTYYDVNILTKSDLITRDIDLFKEFKANITTGFTINYLNDSDRQNWEPNASEINNRINALKKINREGINTYVHIGPYLPEITDLEQITKEIEPYVEEIQIENLNKRNKKQIKKIIQENYPHLSEAYREILETDKRNDSKELIKKAKKLKKITNKEISVFID